MIECLTAMMLSGSGVFALWRFQLAFTRERFSARWQYGFLKLALVFFLLPAGLLGTSLLRAAPPQQVAPAEAPPFSQALPPAEPGAAGELDTAAGRPTEAADLQRGGGQWRKAARPALTALWLSGAAALGSAGAASLLPVPPTVPSPLYRAVLQGGRGRADGLPPPDGSGTEAAAAGEPPALLPFVTGLVRPVIVLPKGEMEPEELRCILLHETLHLRRRDLWVRLAALGVRTLYWFNPVGWLLYRAVVEWSELSCDEALTASMDAEGRRTYGRVILKSALHYTENAGEWAAGLSAPETMRRRLLRMIRWTKMKRGAQIGAALVLALLLTGGCALSMGTYRPMAEAISPTSEGRNPVASSADPAVSSKAPADGVQYPVNNAAEREELLETLGEAYDLGRSDFIIHINGEDDSEIVEVYRNSTQLEELGQERLIDGDWPRNSRGESYGPSCLEELTGSEPDLISAVGIDGTHGYIRRGDMWDSRFNIKTPEDAEAYMAFITALGAYTIPLYDAEGEVIGQFPISGGVPNTEELQWMLKEHQERLGLSDEQIEDILRQH